MPKQPDQESTVYATIIGSGECIPVNTTTIQHWPNDWSDRWYEWEDILREARNNPALDDLIKKAEMVYALTK